MGEVETGDRRGRHHRETVGEGNARAGVGLQQLKQRALLAVIGTGRISRSRTDALIRLVDQGLVVQVLLRRVTPELLPHPFVHAFREGFGEAVGERLEKDLGVRILAFPRGVQTDTGRDGERTDVVGKPRCLGGNEVGQTEVGTAGGLVHLLAKEDEPCPHVRARGVGVHLDVVIDGVGRKHPGDPPSFQQPLVHDPPQRGLGVPEEAPGGLADHRVIENLGPPAREFPSVEERCPVDSLRKFIEVVGREVEQIGVAGRRRDSVAPVNADSSLPRLLERQAVGTFASIPVLLADPSVFLLHFSNQRRGARAAGEAGGDGYGARRVGHMHDRAGVLRRDLHRGMGLGGGRTADQEWDAERFALHLAGDQGHFTKRRRDQP